MPRKIIGDSNKGNGTPLRSHLALATGSGKSGRSFTTGIRATPDIKSPTLTLPCIRLLRRRLWCQ
ncbi:hypothetical protein AHiyo8_00810 [Arthrobacter sp. Hiyo8]|nr:hypothetical protein AHiyo8_00810 [Arthrobacter sp. Hiyo8]